MGVRCSPHSEYVNVIMLIITQCQCHERACVHTESCMSLSVSQQSKLLDETHQTDSVIDMLQLVSSTVFSFINALEDTT